MGRGEGEGRRKRRKGIIEKKMSLKFKLSFFNSQKKTRKTKKQESPFSISPDLFPRFTYQVEDETHGITNAFRAEIGKGEASELPLTNRKRVISAGRTCLSAISRPTIIFLFIFRLE